MNDTSKLVGAKWWQAHSWQRCRSCCHAAEH